MTVLDTFRPDRRVADVTGGAGLYGAGFCRALGEPGARVLLPSRDLAKPPRRPKRGAAMASI